MRSIVEKLIELGAVYFILQVIVGVEVAAIILYMYYVQGVSIAAAIAIGTPTGLPLLLVQAGAYLVYKGRKQKSKREDNDMVSN